MVTLAVCTSIKNWKQYDPERYPKTSILKIHDERQIMSRADFDFKRLSGYVVMKVKLMKVKVWVSHLWKLNFECHKILG